MLVVILFPLPRGGGGVLNRTDFITTNLLIFLPLCALHAPRIVSWLSFRWIWYFFDHFPVSVQHFLSSWNETDHRINRRFTVSFVCHSTSFEFRVQEKKEERKESRTGFIKFTASEYPWESVQSIVSDEQLVRIAVFCWLYMPVKNSQKDLSSKRSLETAISGRPSGYSGISWSMGFRLSGKFEWIAVCCSIRVPSTFEPPFIFRCLTMLILHRWCLIIRVECLLFVMINPRKIHFNNNNL